MPEGPPTELALTQTEREIAEAFSAGVRPLVEELLGRRLWGFNPGEWARPLKARRFVKEIDLEGRGWNLACDQESGVPLVRGGAPIQHGFFAVRQADGGVLLDYRTVGNAPNDLHRGLVDEVRWADERRTLLVGRADNELEGPVPAVFWFTLTPAGSTASDAKKPLG